MCMKYLLIDFGATYIKCAVYNKTQDQYVKGQIIPSPFFKDNKISKVELLNILFNIVSNSLFKRLVLCNFANVSIYTPT